MKIEIQRLFICLFSVPMFFPYHVEILHARIFRCKNSSKASLK